MTKIIICMAKIYLLPNMNDPYIINGIMMSTSIAIGGKFQWRMQIVN